MERDDIHQAMLDVLQEVFAPKREMTADELRDFHFENYCTLSESIYIARLEGLDLRKNAKQQFHVLCRNGTVESFQTGDRGNVIILRKSLKKWIDSHLE